MRETPHPSGSCREYTPQRPRIVSAGRWRPLGLPGSTPGQDIDVPKNSAPEVLCIMDQVKEVDAALHYRAARVAFLINSIRLVMEGLRAEQASAGEQHVPGQSPRGFRLCL